MVNDVIFGPLLGWGIAAVLLFWAVGAYNRLVRLRGKLLRIFAALAAQFERYGEWLRAHELGDTAGVASGDAQLVGMWAGLNGAVAQFEASLVAARANPLSGSAIAALAAARLVLLLAWQRMGNDALALCSAPDGVETMRAEWDQITLQTQSTDKAFALAVIAYNQAVRGFPAILLAWAFGFRSAQTL